jgi:hypothetical protein
LERVPVTVPRREEARDATPGGLEEYASEKVFISYVASAAIHAKLKQKNQNKRKFDIQLNHQEGMGNRLVRPGIRE